MSSTTEHHESIHSRHLRPIVLGVDGSSKNRSAVDWAVAEASRSGRELVLVTAASLKYLPPAPFFAPYTDRSVYEDDSRDYLMDLKARLAAQHPELSVRTVCEPTDAAGLILQSSTDAALTVVGKRGLGTFTRLMIGSTSIAIAGRNDVPTVIVPERWNQVVAQDRPILVGLDLQAHDGRSLEFAFERAHHLAVRLLVLHGWETHPAFMLTEDDRMRWEDETLRAMRLALRPWEEKYPQVGVEVMQREANPAAVLLDHAEMSQLLVLGRHTSSHRIGGFAVGSVDRAVLHYSTTPVAIVPD